ncbi:flagellar hook-associated protein FlgL [Neptunomonas antarctica]|uniref:Flagellar hook-associated protein 3 FlgL n=1 Tax=Neptunomonas antarctica TaxID=619304 RepID=A0A1N7JBV9_9GAMM|nr:flagellar hook-associated protein FlgL [Neptunomonas antarctica]SIS46805.1 flagellar hook-associated protein 3 FlgL [Neptunomonas antarctica]
MRISTQQQYFKSIDQMQSGQAKLAGLQEQISTGKKLNTPSDDPVAAAQVLKLELELAQYEKFDDNINVTERRLVLEETILDDVNTATDRMREITIQAGNGTLSDLDRKTISNELNQLTSYVAGLMNTQDSQGEYLFAGSQGGTQPYVLENGRYEYQGDDGQRQIQVGSALYMPSNDSGKYLFEAADDGLSVQLTGQGVFDYESGVSAIEPFVRNATFPNEAAEAQFSTAAQVDGWGALTVRTAETAPLSGIFTYEVVDSGGNAVNDESGNPLAGGFVTTPLSINIHGMDLEIHEPTAVNVGDIELTVSSEKNNILDVAMNLADILAMPVTTGEERTALNEAVAKGINQFAQVAERNIEARTTLGSRLSTLEQVSSSNLDFKLSTETAISQLVDADLSSVISQFKLAEVTLEAAQATFGRISSLSLFNYIN